MIPARKPRRGVARDGAPDVARRAARGALSFANLVALGFSTAALYVMIEVYLGG